LLNRRFVCKLKQPHQNGKKRCGGEQGQQQRAVPAQSARNPFAPGIRPGFASLMVPVTVMLMMVPAPFERRCAASGCALRFG
jgi:hypothetical protein